MQLINIFVSNVFDIYASDTFLQQFLADNSLDIVKILKHPFLKLSLVYSLIWNQIYKTYPTKRDFINYVNIIKVIPEACNNVFDKAFVEKTLNTFMHVKMGMIKHLDLQGIFNAVQTYVVDLDTQKFVEDQLYKKWQYRFNNNTISVGNNILVTFCSIYNSYQPPEIYKYQINPITNSYNETVVFGKEDDNYLVEHEKIQYTMYKDNHMFMKWIDNIGVIFDNDINMSYDMFNSWIDALGTDKYINLINTKFIHDPCYCYPKIDSIINMFPAVFSCFIYVSNKDYPNQKPLAINKDHSIYYLWTQIPVINTENINITKAYDRYIINNLEHSSSKAKINKYIVLDPKDNLNTIKYDILCGKKTYELHSKPLLDAGYTCTNDITHKTKYVIDLYNELDILNYMANGIIPIVSKANIFVRPMITGYECGMTIDGPLQVLHEQNKVVSDNIISNLKSIAILKDITLFKYLWKLHIDLSCPVRTINSRNGLLLYANFIYLYFIKKLQNIVGLEDHASRGSEYKVVLLDNRPNPLSVLSVLFSLSNLNLMWSCKIYTSKRGCEYYQTMLGDIVEVVHWPALDIKKFHIDVYNEILKSKDFWKSVESKKTLIIQDDGILLRSGIDKFLDYDYIGASWVDNVANEYIKTYINEDLVGNGGFSLRTTDLMIKVCELFEKDKGWLFYKNITQIPEDVYFAYGLKQMQKTNDKIIMPNYNKGTEFASEEVCNMSSLGVHKLWAYHIADVTQGYFNNLLNL